MFLTFKVVLRAFSKEKISIPRASSRLHTDPTAGCSQREYQCRSFGRLRVDVSSALQSLTLERKLFNDPTDTSTESH